MYLWNITINGMGNQFYAGAAWAGSKNWEAMLFGSLDTGNFITVDKPPVSQWVMGLSGRIFGFSSASMLVPQALMAVAAVALLYGAVRRVTRNHCAGLLAGAALALTPVAALMFRFNNPDAAMVLLMMAAAYATVRALERASTKWILLAGAVLGFAFLAKMLEGLMVLPALGLAYVIAAPNPIKQRLAQLFGALVALLLASGWYVLVTLLWPASTRPYLAGSTDNNFMNLVLGYNGFARILGRKHAGGDGAGNGAQATDWMKRAGGHGGFGAGQVRGVGRLFTGEFGFEIGWLLPAALLAMVLVLVARGRSPRTDLMRAAAIIFGGWIVVDGGVLSYMSGMVHPYYCLSIAPGVAGMFAIGCYEMWHKRQTWLGGLGLAAILLTTGIWSFVLLNRDSGWFPQLRWAVLVLTVAAAVLLALPWNARVAKPVAAAALAVGLIGALGGSTAYAFATIGAAHSGGGPAVGPAQTSASGRGGWGQTESNPQLSAMLSSTNSTWAAAIDRSSAAAALELQSGKAVMAIGGFSGSDPTPTLAQFQADVKGGEVTYFVVEQNSHGGRGGDQHADITNWVTASFTPQQVGGATVYKLSGYGG